MLDGQYKLGAECAEEFIVVLRENRRVRGGLLQLLLELGQLGATGHLSQIRRSMHWAVAVMRIHCSIRGKDKCMRV